MKSLLVLSTFTSLVIAAPSILGTGFEGLETFEKVPQTAKREKKSSSSDHLVNPNESYSGSVIPPEHHISQGSDLERTHLGFKKPIIHTKKFDPPGYHGHHGYFGHQGHQGYSGHHGYQEHQGHQGHPIHQVLHGHKKFRDLDGDKEVVEVEKKCKQMTVNICDDKNISDPTHLNSKIEDAVLQKTEENVRESIELAKAAVNSLQFDIQNIEQSSDITKSSWKHGETEYDVKLHEDVEKAKLALQLIQKHFGEFQSLRSTPQNAEILQEVHFRVAKTEEERLEQWKEAIQNIQKNAEIAKNIEDSFRVTDELSTLNGKGNLEQESVFHQSEDDFGMASTDNLGHRGETKSTKRATEPIIVQDLEEASEKMTEKNADNQKEESHSEIAPSASNVLEVHVPGVSFSHETSLKNAENHRGWSASARSDQKNNEKQIINLESKVSGKASNYDDKKSTKNKLDWVKNNDHVSVKSADGLKNIDRSPDAESQMLSVDRASMMKSAVSLSQDKNPINVQSERAWVDDKQINAAKLDPIVKVQPKNEQNTAESNSRTSINLPDKVNIPTTALEITGATQEKGQAKTAWKESEANRASMKTTEGAAIVNNGNKLNPEIDGSHSSVLMKTSENIDLKNQNMKAAESMSGWRHEIAKAASEINPIITIKANGESNITPAHNVRDQQTKVVASMKAAEPAAKSRLMDSLSTSTTHEHNALGKSVGWNMKSVPESSALERNSMKHHNNPQASARSAYGSYGTRDSRVVGVFPNTKVGGCAIPLLLSCNPSVVQGSMAKSHSYASPGYHGSAYKAAEDVNVHNKRETIKVNDVSAKNKDDFTIITSKTSHILEKNDKSE